MALLTVLNQHSQWPGFAALGNKLSGAAGVNLFFVLSGYLITTLLVQEREATGAVSLGRFYIRRSLRIFPAYFTLLLVALVIGWPGIWRNVLVGGLYLSNLNLAFHWGWVTPHPLDDCLSHLWSLCVEEHFYLLWPVAFRARFFQRHAVGYVTLLIVLVNVWRFWLTFMNAGQDRLYPATDTRADSLLVGCLAALLWADAQWRGRIVAGLSGPWMIAILGILVLLLSGFMGLINIAPRSWSLYVLLHSMACAAWLLAVRINENPPNGRSWLAHPALVLMGKLSYGIYLWHMMAFHLSRHLLPGAYLIVQDMVGWVVAFAIAWTSHRFIERPCLRLKSRFVSGVN